MTPRRTPPWVRFRLHLDSLDRYHAGATPVLGAGILGGIVAATTGLAPSWAGFLAGAVPMFVLFVLTDSVSD